MKAIICNSDLSLMNALLLATKRFSSSPPPARDPATAGPGASTGGAEIDEGEFAGAPETPKAEKEESSRWERKENGKK
jgi:hypothetical protein